ncbi:hypothetical protein GPECTOR_25g330 [Gonium pectorale]|uniref:Uncharacterized protein n=1 Tax=Gonium pectorale TaxID=33097 RepID=A0A150GFZ0_GONPE|nr:hypothetical protein GPECTOR_25g330 [Gonium pectorale]|eukprot:KXZ48746.1 hypothetical protein GPECTOR_25g330 [Gonium pectorale]
MADRPGPAELHVRDSPGGGAGAGPSCRYPWTAFTHARADVHHWADEPPSCRDFLKVERNCQVEKAQPGGRDILHCHETREKFRLCSGDRVEKLATTSIETREPLLDGGTWVATRSWEPIPETSGESTADRTQAVQDRRDVAGAAMRPYRPWHAHADDGGGMPAVASAVPAGVDACPSQGSGSVIMNPKVGQAVEEIIQFADEMQRDLEQHGGVHFSDR